VLAVPKSIAISPDIQLNGFLNLLKRPILTSNYNFYLDY
jgi:hypothetical protein